MRYDRDEVLARTDLRSLCEELLGPAKGRGPSATWPCPAPGHGEQTGRTPPVSVFQDQSGDERWRCHACGAGGTAADLVMVAQRLTFREAMEVLARRSGVEMSADVVRLPTRPRPQPRRVPLAPAEPNPVLEKYVAACEARLWSPAGRPMQRWLDRRGFSEEILRVNRVGADPGPRYMGRPLGLPRGGPAVVLPVLEGGEVVYLQARYLHASWHKYENPSNRLVGFSPRLAEIHLAGPPEDHGRVLICEGLPDGLTAAQAGHRAVAVLGAGLPDDRLAASIANRYPWEQLVIAFDADARGRAGAERLAVGLGEIGAGGRVAVLAVPEQWGDLNGWRQGTGIAFAQDLDREVGRTLHPSQFRQPSAVLRELDPLDELLEVMYCRYVLVDDPAQAARAISRVSETVQRWETGDLTPPSPVDGVTELLGVAAYRHLIVDDPQLSAQNLSRVRSTVTRWTGEVELGLLPGTEPVQVPGYLSMVPAVPTSNGADRSATNATWRAPEAPPWLVPSMPMEGPEIDL